MADDEDGFKLTLTEKVQLGAFSAGAGIFLLSYIVAGLFNGFQYTNQWILNNKIPVFFYWSIQLGLLPVYNWILDEGIKPSRYTDGLKLQKWFKQAAWNFTMTGAPFITIAIYYWYNPPSPGLDRVVYRLSYIIAGATFFNFTVSSSLFTYSKKSTR